MFDLLMIMAHKQSYVTVMLNKRRYSSNIAMFDMFAVILHNTFKTTTPVIEAILPMKRCDTFCHSVIIAFFSSSTVLSFQISSLIDTQNCWE